MKTIVIQSQKGGSGKTMLAAHLSVEAERIFRDAAGNLADNAGQILITVGTGRQIQLTGRVTF